MREIRLVLLALVLLLPARIAVGANAVDFFIWLHNRHAVNAVVFDGNTCLQTSGIWNPPANSHWFFMSWPEAPEANNQVTTDIFYAEKHNDAQNNSVIVYENIHPYLGSADLLFVAYVNGGYYAYSTTTAPIPKNGLWHTVFLSLDLAAQVGDVMTVEQPTGNTEFETMTNVASAPTTINWPIMDVYNIGCYYGGNQQDWAKMPMAELYVDLGQFHWLLPQAASDFVSQQGYSLGLSTSAANHDCAEPTAATAIPQMCHTGNANFFVNGPEGGTGLFAYGLSTIAGALTTAPSDPCLRRGIGDGCLVP